MTHQELLERPSRQVVQSRPSLTRQETRPRSRATDYMDLMIMVFAVLFGTVVFIEMFKFTFAHYIETFHHGAGHRPVVIDASWY